MGWNLHRKFISHHLAVAQYARFIQKKLHKNQPIPNKL
jgi:hypothetical protein